MENINELPDNLSDLKELCDKYNIKKWGRKDQIKKRLLNNKISGAKVANDETNFESMSVKELKEICATKGISKGK